MTVLRPVIGLDAALEAVSEVRTEATRRGLALAVAVVDSGGTLVAFGRMDGALPAAVSLCVAKARAAAGFGAPTAALAESAAASPAFLTAAAGALAGEMAFIPGGVPVTVDGTVCGGVGVGGARPDDDHAVAELAASRLQRSASAAET